MKKYTPQDVGENLIKELIQAAIECRENSYAPYSGYRVGAALLSSKGLMYSGCNVENASYGATICAERNTVFTAVAAGQREFVAIAIVGGPDEEEAPLSGSAYPCGMCRQVLSEFGSSDMKIIVAKSTDDYEVFTLGELIPHGFGSAILNNVNDI
ncbi:MAG: cytidine deaminase [Lachnospiraceae bacterium]|nr:cytidine deaminase [Lachnospiraceae bacterium]